MRLKPPPSHLQQSVKQFHPKGIPTYKFHTSLASSYFAHRNYASSTSAGPRQNIAILGSGITGLTAAYYLSKLPNPPHVTVYEKAPRVGGWLNSKYVDVEGGKVLFEQGPRSLRPAMPRGIHAGALVCLCLSRL